jgi:hypothetical protein
MRQPSRGTLLLGLISLVVTIAEPVIEVIWKCRQGFELTEACVWGKSLLPLTSAAGLLLVAPIVFGVLCFIRAAWQTVRLRSHSPN